MTEFTRHDGRKATDLRPSEAKVGVIKRADGSAWFKIGNTEAFAAVYGPREMFPKFRQNSEKGVLRCNYNMMPFSSAGDRVRPGPSRRSKEISMITEKALTSLVDLSKFPNAVVDVFIELTQTDAGTRCAGLTAAAMALAHAGVPMNDMISALAAGKANGNVVVDLDYVEDSAEDGVDLPIAIAHNSGEIVLLQMDGIISRDDILKGIELGKIGAEEMYKVQKDALKTAFASAEGE